MTARHLTKALPGHWHGSYGTACCPAHDDRSPSLSISERDGKLLVHCHTGCDQQAVWDALRDHGLLPERERGYCRRSATVVRPSPSPAIDPDTEAKATFLRAWRETRLACEALGEQLEGRARGAGDAR